MTPRTGRSRHQLLIERYIEEDPHRPGPADARLRDYGVAVWALVGYYKRAVHESVDRVAQDYLIPIPAVEAALAYYRRHQKHIDARRLLNIPSSV